MRRAEEKSAFLFQKLGCAQAGFQDALKWRRGYAAKHLRRLHASRKTRGREKEERGEGGARGGQSGKSELALTAREAELLAVREVESFSHISNNHSTRLSPRRPSSIREIERTNAFAKSTPSPGSRPPPPRAGWREGWMVRAPSRILPAKMQLAVKFHERYRVVVGDVL